MTTLRSLLFVSLFCFGCLAKIEMPADGGNSSHGDGGIPPNWAVLTWVAPTMNTDGTALTDLGGFFVYHGTADPITTDNATKLDVGDVTTYTFKDLDAGMHYFAVSTYNLEGVESAFSMTAEDSIP
jgi:hypothetical protein